MSADKPGGINTLQGRRPDAISHCPFKKEPSYLADEDDTAWYATIHAWHMLGKLQAIEAIPALIEQIIICEREDIDWYIEALLKTFADIGPAAVPQLEAAFSRPEAEWAWPALSICMTNIAQKHLDSRDEVIAIICGKLQLQSDLYDLNASLICDLIKLKAVEAIDEIRAAYAANVVNDAFCGDLESVEVDLGGKCPGPAVGLSPSGAHGAWLWCPAHWRCCRHPSPATAPLLAHPTRLRPGWTPPASGTRLVPSRPPPVSGPRTTSAVRPPCLDPTPLPTLAHVALRSSPALDPFQSGTAPPLADHSILAYSTALTRCAGMTID